ncbi:hypothetical protein K7432_002039 [Basidiobolus ranarum]
MVQGDFEALTICLYGYSQEESLGTMSGARIDSQIPDFETRTKAKSEDSIVDDEEELYMSPVHSYHNLISRASKLNDAQDLYEEIQNLAGEFYNSGTTDPLLNGTLNHLMHDYSYISQSQTLAELAPQGLSKSAHHSVISLHSQKAWVELKQQVCEIEDLSKVQIAFLPNSSEQLKVFQQSLHRINQLLKDALVYARNNRLQFEDDFEKLMSVIFKSMSITSGAFSLSVFRSCLSLVCTLCSCGDDVSRLVLVHNLVHTLLYPLHSSNSSTNLKIQILRAVNICANDPLVVQHILEEKGEQHGSLYKKFILPLLHDHKLPSETSELVKSIVEKITFFEGCAAVQDISLKHAELKGNEGNRYQSSNVTSSTPHLNASDIDIKEEKSIDTLDQFVKSLERLAGFFNVAEFERNEKYSLESSFFRYLSFHDVPKMMTTILMSKSLLESERRSQVLSSFSNFCLVVWQTKQGLIYLSSELEKPVLGSEHLFKVWVDTLIHKDGAIPSNNDLNDMLLSWLSEERLRGSPGILDYRRWWINENQYSRGRADLEYAVSTFTFIPDSRIQFTVDEFVTILIYQVYAVRLVTQLMAHSDSKGKRPVLIGKEDYLQTNHLIKLMHDMCVFNVGKQAIASATSFLGALPVLISYSTSNTQAKRLVTTIFSYYHLLDIKLSPADFDRLKITYQQDAEDDPVYYTVLKYQKHNDLGVLIDILANAEKKDFFKESVVNKIAFCIRILLKHSYVGTDPLSVLSSQLNIIGATQEDPILVYLLRIIESAIENLGEVNKISSLYSDTSVDEKAIVENMAKMSWSDSMDPDEQYSKSMSQYTSTAVPSHHVRRIKMKNMWLELTLLTLELVFSIIYHTGDGLIVSVTLTEPEEKTSEDMSLDITRDDHLLNECFKQILKLLYTLDQLDIRNLKPKDQEIMMNRGFVDSYSLYLLRSSHEVIYRFFDMVNIVVPDQITNTHCEEARGEQYRFKCKIPTSLIGNKVVQYLLDGLHDAPQHFLSGIKLLTSLLPPPYIDVQQQCRKSSDCHQNPPLRERRVDDIYSENCLRMYWTNQLLPLKDNIEESLRTLIFTSCKEIHISLRLLIVQMVDLDIGDLGIARGIFKLLIDQLYEELEVYSHVLHATEYQTSEQSQNQNDQLQHPALGSDDSCIWQQCSFEEQFVASRISRLLCLLLSLVKIPSGHFYLLDIFECNIRNGLDHSIGMFFDIIELLGASHFVSDLAIEIICLLSDHWEQFDRRIYLDNSEEHVLHSNVELYAQSTQLSELISNLLDWVQSDKPTRLQNRALCMLTDISRSVIGTLTILSNPDFCYAIHEIMNESMKKISSDHQHPFTLEKMCQTLNLSKLLYDQWRSHAIANSTNNDIKITLFGNLLGPFGACIEQGQACRKILESREEKGSDSKLLKLSCELLEWLFEVAHSLQAESNSGRYRFDEQFDGIEACFIGLERIFQTRKRTLVDFLKSRDLTNLSKCDDYVYHEDFEEIFYFSNEVRDFKAYALRMFPGFSIRKRVKVYDEESDDEGDPVIIPFEPHHVSSLTREDLHRTNLGGGKAYQSNEFRNPYGARKANAARLPSVHVDDFLKKPTSEVLTSPMKPSQPLDNNHSPIRPHGHLPYGSMDTSPQPNPRGRMNPANPRTNLGTKQWPTDARHYRPSPGFSESLPPNPMVGPPLNDFEVNRRGAFQRFPNGFPPGGGVPPPYYNPHYYPGIPQNQGYSYERPYFPNGPNQFFDSGQQQPRPRFPPNSMHMEYRDHMEPVNSRYQKGPNIRPNGSGRTM